MKDYRTHIGLKRSEIGMGGSIWPLFIILAAIIFFAFIFVDFKEKLKIRDNVNHPDIIKVENAISKLKPTNDKIKKKIAIAIASNSKYYGIDYRHLVAIAYVESGFDPNAINKDSKDYGLMQINWGWHGKKFARHSGELMNVYKNVETACKIIKQNKNNGFTKISSYHSLDRGRQIEYETKLKIALRRI